MSKKTAFIFPGQGAQYVGMGKDFYEQFPVARDVFEEADRLLERPFSKLVFEGPAEELTLTKNSQLAIFITSIAILRVVQQLCPELEPQACAGLSLGEYSALVAANKLSFEEALFVVKARAEWMQQACETSPGTMNVVLGMEPEAVQDVLKECDGVWLANLNCPGQVVISGTHQGIEAAGNLLKEKGAKRVLPLDVSGAFHSGLMQSAQDLLEPMIAKLSIHPSSIEVVMNVSGSFVSASEHVLESMIRQVTQPVLWQKGVEALVEKGYDRFIEIGPGKTLAGMNKRMNVAGTTISVGSVEDLEGVGYAPIA